MEPCRPPMTQTFGALLKRHRLASGLTQAELAERAGLSTEAVSALERGVNRTPRKDTVALLADALDLEGQDRALLERASRQQKAAVARPSADSDQSPTRGGVLPLFGRDSEMALVQQVLDGVAPPILFLTGEPGVGKTRLLREAGQQASSQGWAVLAGECQRQGGPDSVCAAVDNSRVAISCNRLHCNNGPTFRAAPGWSGCYRSFWRWGW